MQNIKDSFYVALRDRLAALDPSRTVAINGQVRPAIVVRENETPSDAPDSPGAFYLSWPGADVEPATTSARQPLLSLTCEIEYFAEGTDDASYQDRGRLLDALDEELLSITTPSRAALQDHSATPPADLGQELFWQRPRLGALQADGRYLRRKATVQVLAYSEAVLA